MSSEDLYAREREMLIESDPIELADEVLRLRAKVKSGVEAAHDIQRKYYEHSRPDYLSWYDTDYEAEKLSLRDDAAEDILAAMEEPMYYQT